jgi:hypothetical protein
LKLELVTALVDASVEDKVVATLISEGFALGIRCYSVEQLLNYLASKTTEQRLLVVTDDEFGLTSRECAFLAAEQRSHLRISSHIPISSEEIKSRAREALRRSEGIVSTKLKCRVSKNFIGVTGSSGSPGISTIALNVASELSEFRNVYLIDADPYRRDIHQRLGLQSSDNVTVAPQFSIRSINVISELESEDIDTKIIHIFDIGEVPQVSDLLTDRRKVGREFCEVLQQCGQILYIAQSENSSISELEHFRSLMEENFPQTTLLFVLNKSGNSNRQGALQKSFNSRLGDIHTFSLPREYSVLDRSQSQYSTLMEVAPRSGLRRAIKELSIYLDKSL